MKTFKELGLNSEIMESLNDLGFTEPTHIQEKAIPFILNSTQDLIALAQTGTGKTAAFGLPILNQIKAGTRDLQAIVLCPTRELCLQISQDIQKFAKYSKRLDITPVYGGERIDIQIKALRRGTNIVIGTPGRVHDLIRKKFLKLQNIKWAVLDEADEMLDMGFKDDLDAILAETPKNKQTLLFSATISKSVHAIAKKYMKDIHEISAGKQNIGAENVSHEYYIISARDRFDSLKRILDFLPGVYGILFCRTKRETQDIADKLNRSGYDCEALHGDVSQTMRTKIMARFKTKTQGLLVATDVAARGIDVSNLTHVINYNLPDKNEIYTHRTGRTGRAKKSGIAISIITPGDRRRIRDLEHMIGKTFAYKKIPQGEEVYQKQIDSFLEEIIHADTKELAKHAYFPEITRKINTLHKDDLINYLIAQKFKDLASPHALDLNAKTKAFDTKLSGGSGTRLKINIGKRDRFDIKALFALFNSNPQLKGLELGEITLLSDFSVFSVETKDVSKVISYLNGARFGNKTIVISRDNHGASYSRGTYQGPRKRNSGFARNKIKRHKRTNRNRR
ncbi:MAG: DEAD/DEAH box helicase [Patescibacteria group bacterium]|jgi:ATP-dependent RNA helicase DeaD